MKAFSVLFQEQNSPIIIYNGKIVYRYLRCTKSGEYIFQFRNVKSNSEHMQFFMLHLLKMNGKIFVNDKPILITKTRFPQFAMSEEELRNCHGMKITLTSGQFTICNGEDTSGEGLFADSLIFGAAITIERLDSGWFRFNCNDTENDDDFNDFIFEVKVESNGETVDIIEEWQPNF